MLIKFLLAILFSQYQKIVNLFPFDSQKKETYFSNPNGQLTIGDCVTVSISSLAEQNIILSHLMNFTQFTSAAQERHNVHMLNAVQVPKKQKLVEYKLSVLSGFLSILRFVFRS